MVKRGRISHILHTMTKKSLFYNRGLHKMHNTPVHEKNSAFPTQFKFSTFPIASGKVSSEFPDSLLPKSSSVSNSSLSTSALNLSSSTKSAIDPRSGLK